MARDNTLYVMATAVAVMSCNVDSAVGVREQSRSGNVALKVAVPQSLSQVVVRVEYVISGDDMTTMQGDLLMSGDGTARGTVFGIKVVSGRLFILNAYDGSGGLTHTGSTLADILFQVRPWL